MGLVDQLIKESDVPDKYDALSRPFFMGKTIFISDTDPVGTVVHEAAFTEKRILARLGDERFCRYCFFLLDDRGHDYCCRKSPWKIGSF